MNNKERLEIIREKISETECKICSHETFLNQGIYEEGLSEKLSALQKQNMGLRTEALKLTSSYVETILENIISFNLESVKTKLVAPDTQKTSVETILSDEVNENLADIMQSSKEDISASTAIYSNPYTGNVNDVKMEIGNIATGASLILDSTDEQQKRILQLLNDEILEATNGEYGLKEALSNPEMLKFPERIMTQYKRLQEVACEIADVCKEIGSTEDMIRSHQDSIRALNEELNRLKAEETHLIEQESLPNKMKSAFFKAKEGLSEIYKRVFIGSQDAFIESLTAFSPLKDGMGMNDYQVKCYERINELVGQKRDIGKEIISSLDKIERIYSNYSEDKISEATVKIIKDGQNIIDDIDSVIDSVASNMMSELPEKSDSTYRYRKAQETLIRNKCLHSKGVSADIVGEWLNKGSEFLPNIDEIINPKQKTISEKKKSVELEL